MTVEHRLSAPKRRTRAEVRAWVTEFMRSGMRRSEFCQSRGLSFSTLDRHLKKRRWKRRRQPVSTAGRLVPVELSAMKSPAQHEPSCGLAVLLPGGLRIEVHPNFEAQSAALPSSAPSKACQYGLTLWRKLTRFLEYPELELSNNLSENSMRPVALGRKNWIHIGSPQAGPKIAEILSVVESCRRLEVPVRDYFSTILPGLADLPIRCLPDLTLGVWAARRS